MKTAVCSAWLLVAPALVAAQAPDPQGLEFFEQKIRPVLVQQCYSCHSEEARASRKLQAHLLLDSQPAMLAGGETGPALVRGKSAESLLIKALKFDGLEMPPSGKLPDDVIADFAKWIDMGAPDPRQESTAVQPKREIDLDEGRQFWSFRPLQSVTPPEVKDSRWSLTPIDRFLAAKHEEHGLVPNAAATKEKLIRRVYFDLIGLPPTPEQVDAFLKDESATAFEKVVDELLASERYGERWARHWLDVARFAESGGYEFDGFRPGAYHYRDWVIRAFNNDLPYDEFVRLQLAGDKLLPDDYHAAAATGFLVAGPYPGQITAKTVERIRYDQIDDMLMTIGGSMMGLTIGCVRCHEHKYDPIPHQDYYGLAAALATTAHGPKPFDPDPKATQLAQERHRAEHIPYVDAMKSFAAKELPQRFEAWRKAELPKQPESPRWQIFDAVNLEAELSYLKHLPNGVIAHDGKITLNSEVAAPGRQQGPRRRENEDYTVTVHTYQKKLTALRLDLFTDKSLPKRGPGLNADGSFLMTEFQVTAKPLDVADESQPVALKLNPVFAAFEDKDQPLKNVLDRKPATAWVIKENAGKDNAAIFEIDGGLPGFANGTELKFDVKFRDVGVGRLRLAFSTEPNPATWAGDVEPQHLGETRALLALHKNQLPETVREPMLHWFTRFDAEAAKVFDAERDHIAKRPRPPVTEVYTTIAGGQDVFFLRRGEVDNKQGRADPSFVQVLDRRPEAQSAVADLKNRPLVDARVDLANWMTNADRGSGPLLARVMVNRVWQHHFGEGLVRTPNDFGVQGERPSHPELLEWLAAKFVESGWKLKPLHKQMLMTAAYQQAHDVRPENVAIDPENRYLWHHRPQRLDAEIIRDSLLAVGDTLDATMYGPSVLDNTARRSVYLRVKRSELIPFMTMFDAPEPTQSIGERVSTTVPTQALAMLNSPFVRQQAEKLAARAKTAGEGASTIDRAYQIALARLPTDAERRALTALIEQQPDRTDAALVECCQLLLCLNEFVYVD
ncbi:MAG TPA: PSD1 and planctomycete cytochrome C domain-containing protein [Planctomycetaceae bacterium]|nr:PSD1 and planctomycete cytochrome C domain-containing protein [Planctomycetaceae bacterium]